MKKGQMRSPFHNFAARSTAEPVETDDCWISLRCKTGQFGRQRLRQMMPRDNPQTGASPYPKRARIHTHHPCPGCIPAIRVPDASPPSMSRIHTHRRIPRVAPWADMPRSFRAHPCPPSVSPIHIHHPCPGCMPTVQSPGLHPGLVCVDPLGQTEPCARGSSASVAVGT